MVRCPPSWCPARVTRSDTADLAAEALQRLYRDPQVYDATQERRRNMATGGNMQKNGSLDSFGVMLGDEHFWLPSC